MYVCIFQVFNFFCLQLLFLNWMLEFLDLVLKDQIPCFFTLVKLVHGWSRGNALTYIYCITLILDWHMILRSVNLADLIGSLAIHGFNIKWSALALFLISTCTTHFNSLLSQIVFHGLYFVGFVLFANCLKSLWLPIQCVYWVQLLLTL